MSRLDRPMEAKWSSLQVRLAVASVALYFANRFITESPGILLPAIRDSLGFTSSYAATITAVATATTAFSKMLIAPLVDTIGGQRSMFICVALMTIFVGALSFAESKVLVLLLNAAQTMFNAPCWPAAALWYKARFSQSQLDGLFRMLAITSRLGSFVGFQALGPLLGVLDCWQGVLRVSACLGIASILFSYGVLATSTVRGGTPDEKEAPLMGGTPDEKEAPLIVADDGEVIGQRGETDKGESTAEDADGNKTKLVLDLLRQPWYRWGCLTEGCLLSVSNNVFIISSFFADSITEEAREVVSEQLLGSLFPLGFLICLVIPGYFYPRLQPKSKRALCLALQGVSLCSAVGLVVTADGEQTGLEAMLAVKALLVFMLTFGIGIALYIPLATGYCAMVPKSIVGLAISWSAGFSYGCAVAYQFAMSAMLANDAGWRGVWIGQSCIILVSIFSMYRFMALTMKPNSVVTSTNVVV